MRLDDFSESFIGDMPVLAKAAFSEPRAILIAFSIGVVACSDPPTDARVRIFLGGEHGAYAFKRR